MRTKTNPRFLELTLVAEEGIAETLLRDIEHYNGILEIQSSAARPLPHPWT